MYHTTTNTEWLINVTQDDIDNGIRGRTRSCPIALACQRVLANEKFSWYISNGCAPRTDFTLLELFIRDWLDLHIPTTVYYVTKNNKEVNDFVIRFDSGERVNPFTFTLVKWKNA